MPGFIMIVRNRWDDVMHTVYFQPLAFSTVQQRPLFSGAAQSSAPLDDLRAAWRDPAARALIEASIIYGNFKNVPRNAQSFLAKLKDVCSRPLSNEARYTALRECFEGLRQSNRDLANQFLQEKDERVQRRVQQVKDLLGDFRARTYVDIGSGDGKITSGLRQVMAPSPLNVCGPEVRSFDSRVALGLEVAPSRKAAEGVQVVAYDGKNFPLKRNAVDLMTLFAVLHHVEDPLTLLKNVKDCLRPGGKLVVREFDSGTETMKRFNIVMDDMLYKVYSPNPDVPCPGNFKSREDWMALFRQAGFRVSGEMHNPEPGNPYKPFMVALEKPAFR